MRLKFLSKAMLISTNLASACPYSVFPSLLLHPRRAFCESCPILPFLQCPSTPSPHDLGNLPSFLQMQLKYHLFPCYVTFYTYPEHSFILSISSYWSLYRDSASTTSGARIPSAHVSASPVSKARSVLDSSVSSEHLI